MNEEKEKFVVQLMRLVDTWRFIMDEKRKIREPLPSDIMEQIEKLDKEVEKHKKNTIDTLKQDGYDISDPMRFIREHADEFGEDDRMILLTIAKLKSEVNFVKDVLKQRIDNPEDVSMMQAAGSEVEKQTDSPQQAKKIRDRKKKFKKAGLGNDWKKI